MQSPYNISTTPALNECITSELYANASLRISRALCLKGYPLLAQFTTSSLGDRFRPSQYFQRPMSDYNHINRYYFNNNITSTPCMFVYRDYGGMSWDKRICGSTDNHFSRGTERIRAFEGDSIQCRTILNNMCCETDEINKNFPEVLTGKFESLMDELIITIQKTLVNAIFAPVSEKNDGVYSTVTFEADTTEIDLTGALSLSSILEKLTTIVNAFDCFQEYYWFVSPAFYGKLSALSTTTSCCSVIMNAVVLNDAGQMVPGLGGLQFDKLSNVKIFPIPGEYLPLNGAGKMMSPLFPKGSIAWTLTASSWLDPGKMMNTGGASVIDLMSLSQQRYQEEMNEITRPSAVLAMMANPSPAINYNAELAFFTSLVAGRLPGKLYRVLIDVNPTVAPAPPLLAAAPPVLDIAPFSIESDVVDAATTSLKSKASR